MTSPTLQLLNNLGENISLLVVLAIVFHRLRSRIENPGRPLVGAGFGLLFAGFAMLGMLIPIQLAEGIYFDGRPILVMAAVIHAGSLAGWIAAGITALFRLYLGGPGAPAHVPAILVAALIGQLFAFRARHSESALLRLTLGVALAGESLALMWFILPRPIAPLVVGEMMVPLLLYYPFGYLLFGVVLSYERQRNERERALLRSERRFRAIFNTSYQLFGLLDPEGALIAANRTALDFIGAEEDGIVGLPLWQTPWCQNDERARRLLRAALCRVARGQLVHFETEIEGRDGRRAVLDCSLQPLRDENGKVVMLLAEGRDMTERKTAETRLQQTEEHLRQAQKMEAVGQLTGGLAHDFNNLLTVVGGNLELVLRRKQGEDERRLIDAAMRGVRRAATLTQQLLAFSRKQRLNPEIVAVNSIARDTATMLNRLLGERVELKVELAADLVPGYFDPHQMETAILNLAINGRDAMPRGGVLTISTSNEAPTTARLGAARGFVCITVADTGSGMSADVLRRATEPFFTTKQVGRGSGLGLSMVYGFVTQSGGHVDIASTPGAGTAVRLYLPAATGAEIATEAAAAPARTGPALGRGEVILVVEDEDDVRELAASLLEDLGYSVRQAEDSDAALTWLRRGERVDLIFTDLVMPGMRGEELATAARRLRPGVRILFTSGYSQQGGGSECDEKGVFIGKPFESDELACKVREILDAAPRMARIAAASD